MVRKSSGNLFGIVVANVRVDTTWGVQQAGPGPPFALLLDGSPPGRFRLSSNVTRPMRTTVNQAGRLRRNIAPNGLPRAAASLAKVSRGVSLDREWLIA